MKAMTLPSVAFCGDDACVFIPERLVADFIFSHGKNQF